MPESNWERLTLAGILVAFAALGTLFSITVPIFEASDELWHYPMVEHVATHWDLPVQPLEPGATSGPWRQEASQPPLYYALGALLTSRIDTSDMEQVRHLNPHVAAGEITPDRSNLNLVVHNPALERPWRGTVLAVHLVRFLSVALGTWAVYLTWALTREIFPAPSWIALSAAAVHAFTPMYLFISSSVNNDNLIVPLCSLALLLMVRRVKAADPDAAPWGYPALGLVVGLAMLTKASGMGLLPLAGATVAWEAWRAYRRSGDLRRAALLALRNGALILLPAFLVSGWWFYRNARLYGDGLGLNAFYAVLGTRDVPADLGQLWAERFAFAAGYWGNFGGLNVPMAGWIYALLNAIAVVAAAGLILRLARWLARSGEGEAEPLLDRVWPFRWQPLTAARALAWAWPAAVLVSWSRWAAITWSSQGRLIFSAIPLWSLALVWGLTAWLPRRAARLQAPVAATLPAFLLALCLVALPLWIVPAYVPPTAAGDPAAEPPIPLDRRFGETLRLRGYAVEMAEVRPGEPVALTLYWEALAPTATDHSVFVHVLGRGERIVAQRDAFPGRGLVSTTWLEPGTTWTERYRIKTPRVAYAPDALVFAVGVSETSTGRRLKVYDDDGDLQGEMAFFGDAALERDSSELPNPVDVKFGRGMVLAGYDLSDTTVYAGDALTVTLHWRADAPIDGDYTVSVQLIDAAWNKAAQSDAWPLEGAAPTSSWKPGQTLVEQRVLPIAPGTPASAYDLRVAVYRMTEDGSLEHLPVVWEPGQMPAEAVTLTRVRVQ